MIKICSRIALIGLTLGLLLGMSACDVLRPKPVPPPDAFELTSTPTSTPVPSSTPSPEPTLLPTRPPVADTPTPAELVSPLVVQRQPEAGQELGPDETIQLVFDRAMNKSAVEAAFAIQPAVSGKFEWRDVRTLNFKPDKPLARSSTYDVFLNQTALAADGSPLRSAYQFRVATAGFLQVSQVVPAPDAVDVEARPRLTMIFNRPVVPLTALQDQASLPQPLMLDPPVLGHGEWLNSSIYVFEPTTSLVGGLTYTAKISRLEDTDGNPLADEYTWRFSTQPPQVVWVSPDDGQQQVSVDSAVRIEFNQPIDAGSAARAFSMSLELPPLAVTSALTSVLTGTFEVVSHSLIFTPSARLPFDTNVQVRLAAGLSSAGAASASLQAEGMRQDFTWTFHTVPLPRILRTEPANGEKAADPYTGFTLYFNTPIDPTSVMTNLHMTPPLSPALVYTYSWGDGFGLSFGAQPSTDYEVRIGPDIADPYGNTTGQTMTVRFRTRDLEPALRLHTPDFIGTYNAYTPLRLYAAYVNVKRADFKLYQLRPDSLFQARDWYKDTPPDSALLSEWSQPLEAPLNQIEYALIDVSQQAGALEPGLYLLDASAPELTQNEWGRRTIMVVSKINLVLKTAGREALVWANDLRSGQPVAKLSVMLYDSAWQSSGSCVTGPDGVGRVTLGADQSGDQVSMAFSAEPFALVSNGWSNGVSPWDFGLDMAYGWPDYRTHLYTDRSIYRPGQIVYFRGIVRAEQDVKYDLAWLEADRPGQREVHVTINDSTGQPVFDSPLLLDSYGVFSGEVKLASEAALGYYDMAATLAADGSYFNASFQVASYRPPEYEVIVTPAQVEITRGVPVTANVQVRYFSGGAVPGVAVNWNVVAQDYTFTPAWGGGYSFRDEDDPWRCFDCWWGRYQPPESVLLSGSGVSDEHGQLQIELSESQFQSPVTGSLRLVIEATAAGPDNQFISGRAEVVAHRAGEYIGLAPERYIGKEGEPFTVKLVTVDWHGDTPRLPDRTVTAWIYQREWKNTFIEGPAGGGRWKAETLDTLLNTQTLTTDDRGEAILTFVPPQGGSYRIVVAGGDDRQDQVSPYSRARSALFVWVAGKDYVSWQRENNDRINLIANKVTYQPGETAEILIPSPFQEPHLALVTVERGGILQHKVISMTSNSQVYSLPLTAGYAPNVYVSVVLFKSSSPTASPEDQDALAQGLADYKVGIVPLTVEPAAQILTVTLSADPAQAQPGQTVTYTLRASDAAGKAVQAAFSLDLVDKAVLTLSPRSPNAVVEAFYGRRGLGVQTSSGLAVSVNKAMAELAKDLGLQQEEATKAGGAVPPMGTPTPAPAAVADTFAGEADSLDGRAKGALSFAAAPAGVQIRQEFADTAYWKANLVTDQDGQAQVAVKLPDNLTTWVMRGVGVTRATLVGEGTVELVAAKPLLIRPVTPRFFVAGDRAQLAAIVSNNVYTTLRATVALSATGLTLSTPAVHTITLPAGGQARLTWDVQVQDVTQSDLVFWASAVPSSSAQTTVEYSDASKPRLATGPDGSLRVTRYSAPDIVGTAGDLPEAGGRTEVVALPPQYDERQGELLVQLDPSLAAAMQDGLGYLEHYEYECTEQTVSRFLPNVLTYQALKDLGISDPDLESRLPGLVQAGLDKLYSQQREDGGWGWWRDSRESNVHLTTYVVFAHLKARQAGFEVREEVLQRGQQFLNGQLVEARDLNNFSLANRQAFVLYTLAEGQQAPTSSLTDLFENRDKLSHYARAFLALALALNNPDDGRIATLLSDLNNAAILSATGAHWEESFYDWWAMNTDTRSTAIILDAMARLDKGNALAPNVVRWLMVARRSGYWETTQETAWALMGLTDWMKASGELQGHYDYAVFLNDADIGAGQVKRSTLRENIKLRVAVADLLADSNRLRISRGDGPGRLYYTAHLRVFLPVKDLQPVARGVVVQRRYSLADCTDGLKCPEVREARVGDVIRVGLTLIAPNDLYYVVVEDPLPAGGEAIDPSLATSSQLEQTPSLRREASGVEVVDVEAWATPGKLSSRYYTWWWGWYSRTELRDDKVVLFADQLPKGTYTYSYTFRATSPGEYQVIPTVAREFYFPEVFGRSAGRLLSIAP